MSYLNESCSNTDLTDLVCHLMSHLRLTCRLAVFCCPAFCHQILTIADSIKWLQTDDFAGNSTCDFCSVKLHRSLEVHGSKE